MASIVRCTVLSGGPSDGLPERDFQKPIEPFSLDVPTLDGLTEKPAKHEAAYLVDMARVEALDTMGENRKAVQLLDRHV